MYFNQNQGGSFYGTDPVGRNYDPTNRFDRRSTRYQNRSDTLREKGFDSLSNVAQFRSGVANRKSNRIDVRKAKVNKFLRDGWGANLPDGSKFKDTVSQAKENLAPGSKAQQYAQNDPRAGWLNSKIQGFTPERYGQTIATQQADWAENGPFGGRYAGRETATLDNLNTMSGRGYANEALGDVMKFKNELAGQKSQFERSLEQNALLSTQGRLTDPNSQYLESQLNLADRLAQRGDKRLAQQFGAQRGIGSGAYQRAMLDRTGELEDKSFAMATDLQKQQADQSFKFLTENKALENALLGHAVDLQKSVGGTRLEATKQTLSHINNAAQLANQQADLALKQDLQKMNAEFGQLDRMGNVIQRDQNYDIAYKGMMSDNFAQTLNAIMGALSTGQEIGNNFMGGFRKNNSNQYLNTLSGML